MAPLITINPYGLSSYAQCSYSDLIMSYSPLSYYRMNDSSGSLVDVGSNGLDAAPLDAGGSVTYGVPPLINSDDAGTAIQFNGNFSFATSGAVVTSGSVSVVYWLQADPNVLHTTGNPNSVVSIMGQYNSAATYAWGEYMAVNVDTFGSFHAVQAEVNGISDFGGDLDDTVVFGTPAYHRLIADNEPHMVVMVRDNRHAGLFRIFMDGELIDEEFNFTNDFDDIDFNMGKLDVGNREFFRGVLDEVAILPVALERDQVQELYAAGRGVCGDWQSFDTPYQDVIRLSEPDIYCPMSDYHQSFVIKDIVGLRSAELSHPANATFQLIPHDSNTPFAEPIPVENGENNTPHTTSVQWGINSGAYYYEGSPVELFTNDITSFSMECWWKFNDILVPTTTNIMLTRVGSDGSVTGTDGFTLYAEDGANARFRGRLTATGGTAQINGNVDGKLKDGNWHHVVLQWSGTLRMYVDTIQQTDFDTGATGTMTFNTPMYSVCGGAGGNSNGSYVIHAAFYKNKVLTSQEIEDHYNARFPT